MAQRTINEITREVIGAAIEVHRSLGPGLLESAYQRCLCRELELRGIQFERELPLPVTYKGIVLDCGYRLDLLVGGTVVIETKSVDESTGPRGTASHVHETRGLARRASHQFQRADAEEWDSQAGSQSPRGVHAYLTFKRGLMRLMPSLRHLCVLCVSAVNSFRGNETCA